MNPSEFWGPRTASIDWCEANYDTSRFVCEWFNTLSSFALIGAGLVGVFLHWKTLERRFLAAFSALAVVGLGSVAFHATLRFELQMLDELPMVYLALAMVFILVQMNPRQQRGMWFPLLLAIYAMALTWLVSCTRGAVEFWVFQLSFGSLELFCLMRVWLMYRRTHVSTVRSLFRIGMVCYAAAIAAWFIDVRFCALVSMTLPAYGIPNPQLHAVWHVLVSCGFYSLLLLLAHARIEARGARAAVGWRAGCLPFVHERAQSVSSHGPRTVIEERRSG